MIETSFSHARGFNNNLQNLSTSKESLSEYALGILSQHPEHKQMVNNIALEVQKAMNDRSLSKTDLQVFSKELLSVGFKVEETAELLQSLIIMSKHQNTFFYS